MISENMGDQNKPYLMDPCERAFLSHADNEGLMTRAAFHRFITMCREINITNGELNEIFARSVAPGNTTGHTAPVPPLNARLSWFQFWSTTIQALNRVSISITFKEG